MVRWLRDSLIIWFTSPGAMANETMVSPSDPKYRVRRYAVALCEGNAEAALRPGVSPGLSAPPQYPSSRSGINFFVA